MATAEETKCAHPQCNCPASEGQQYCSTSCEQSDRSGQSASAQCGCNHQQCAQAA